MKKQNYDINSVTPKTKFKHIFVSILAIYKYKQVFKKCHQPTSIKTREKLYFYNTHLQVQVRV